MSGKFLARASALSLAMLLAACGGGDDSSPLVDSDTDQTENNQTDGTGDTNTDGDVTTPDNPDTNTTTSTLALGTGSGGSFSAGDLGAQSIALDSGDSTQLSFNIVDTTNSNTVALGTGSSILFTSACLDAGLASIENAPSTVNSGSVIATYNSGSCIGSDTVYAFLDGSADVYASDNIMVSPKAGDIDLALGTLSGTTFNLNDISKSSSQAVPIGSTVRLEVNIYDTIGGELQIGQPFTVQFLAACTDEENNESSFSQAQVSTTTGIAETNYTVGACQVNGQTSQQTISAQLVGQDNVGIATTSIDVATSNAFQLTAETPEPQSIAPSFLSQSDRQTTSIVSFTLENSSQAGIGDETITLRIDEPGVAEFDLPSGGTSDTLDVTTDSNGRVSATVRALTGIDQQVFRVIASYDGLETLSMPIAVNSKLPYEPKFSISTTNFAPDVQGKDGIQVEMTVLAADKEGNRIRGNTPVNFSTTEGSIDPECQLDDQGRCTITWESLAIGDAFTTVTATTHGRRTDDSIGQISDSISMLMSTSDGVQVELVRTNPDPSNPIDSDTNTYCATTWVTLPNQGTTEFSPPTGTTLEFEAVEGEFLNDATSSSTIGSDASLLTSSGYTSCTDVKPQENVEQVDDGSGGTIEQTTLSVVLSVTVTPPGENATVATGLISEQETL